MTTSTDLMNDLDEIAQHIRIDEDYDACWTWTGPSAQAPPVLPWAGVHRWMCQTWQREYLGRLHAEHRCRPCASIAAPEVPAGVRHQETTEKRARTQGLAWPLHLQLGSRVFYSAQLTPEWFARHGGAEPLVEAADG